MVDVDGSCHFSAESQPQSIGLVWGLAAKRRPVCIHQMNRMNSCNDSHYDDSTINIVVVIIITTTWQLTTNFLVTPAALKGCVGKSYHEVVVKRKKRTTKMTCLWKRLMWLLITTKSPSGKIELQNLWLMQKNFLTLYWTSSHITSDLTAVTQVNLG